MKMPLFAVANITGNYDGSPGELYIKINCFFMISTIISVNHFIVKYQSLQTGLANISTQRNYMFIFLYGVFWVRLKILSKTLHNCFKLWNLSEIGLISIEIT